MHIAARLVHGVGYRRSTMAVWPLSIDRVCAYLCSMHAHRLLLDRPAARSSLCNVRMGIYGERWLTWAV